MKNIYKNVVFILVSLCLCLTMALPHFTNSSLMAEQNNTIYSETSDSKNNLNSNLLTSDSVAKIYLEAEKTDKNGVAQPKEGAGYKVGFYIKATSAVSNVKVSWRTRDMTAIASQGDYASKDTTYTLNGTSSPLIYVNIYNQGVATYVSRKIGMKQKDNDYTADDPITRNFFIELTDISCDKNIAVIDNTKKQLIASAGYSYNFSVTKFFDSSNNNYILYFSNYEWPTNIWEKKIVPSYTPKEERIKTVIQMDKSPNIQDGKRYYSSANYPSQSCFDPFLKLGYADLYATIWGDTYEDKYIGSSDNIRVSIVYADNNEYICQYDIEYGGWSSEHTYQMLQMQTSSRFTTNPGKVVLGGTGYNHYYTGEYYYKYWSEFYEIKDPNRKIQIEFWDYEDYEGRYFYNMFVKSILVDTTAPVVKDYYLQKEPIKNGDKLGLSVRFSEPVHVKGNKKPVISARINNNANYYADFEYVAGSGTDTLYFEWTPTDKNIDITSFTLCDFLNASSISDYSVPTTSVTNPQLFKSDDTDSFRGDSSVYTYYTALYSDNGGGMTDEYAKQHRLSKPILNKTINYKVDLRTPNIHTEVRASDMASKYVEVPIIIESLKSDGKLYYSWINSTITPDKYENEVTNLSDIYTIRATDMNGRYYLHLKAVSTYGKEQILIVGPFKFDGEPPNISKIATGDLTSRTFNLKITDGAETTDWSSGVADVTLMVAKDIEGKDVVKTYPYNGAGTKIFTKDVIVSATDLGLGENEYGTFYIFVTAYDNLGNKAQTDPVAYKFDRRTFFDIDFVSAKTNANVDKVLDISTDDYKVIDITDDVWIHFTSSDTTGATIKLIVKNANNETVAINNHAFSSISKDFCIKSYFAPGFYTVSFTATESGTIKYSSETAFYFTKNMQDEGLEYYTKISNGLLFSNKVYQLNNDLLYYYMDKDGNIQSVRYGNSSKPTTFSSKYEAVKYLKFMEYQDLYPIKINRTQADLLNGKSSPNFLKASGETMVAQENQIWIRYKTTTFDKDPTTSHWAYYYYQGDDLTLRQEYFSMNLLSSISAVAERIAKNYGKDVMLVGEGNVNKYNEPYLEKDQIHSSYESISKTKCDIAFAKAIFYDGDAKIYNSTITESGKSYNLATNLELLTDSSYTRLFYKGKDNTSYTEIDLTKYTNLSQVITASGVYDLIELGALGIRKYSVYIDKDAPILTGYIQDLNGNTATKEFDKSSQGITYTTKSFSFGQFSEIEKDDFAYVSVWKYLTNKTGELLNVYSRSDLQSNSFVLENGDYHIEVYDRSGNGYSFIIRVNAQNFVCETIEKKDEYIMVTCNREKNEIQAYEIYLDGELLTSKYSQKQRFEQSGVYSIHIVDIFGNEYNYEINFQRTYPTVTWQYYDSASGGYVPFDYETSKKMRITRVNDTTFNIVTSSLLQFKYNSLYKYQFVGNVDYSESGISHVVKINTLQSFTLKITYETFKEATVTYMCEIDDQAPNISIKNEIEIFDYNEIKYFNEQLESGNIGDILKYNTISYSKRNVVNTYLTNGDTVQSRILKLTATDNYGISLIKVYLDDTLLLEETQNFSNVVLSRYGSYRIEAYDIYENKSEFTFTNNVQEKIKYYVDGTEENAFESTLRYFDDNGNFTKTEYGREFVELLFKSDCVFSIKITGTQTIYSTLEITDGKIYFLTYKIGLDGDSRVITTEKSSEIFDISQSDILVDDWYLIINKNQCGKDIYAKYDSDKNISLKIVNDSETLCTIEGRVRISSEEPFYFKTELSTEKSDVVLKNADGDKIGTNQNETQIKINKAFYVDGTKLSDKIKLVKVYFSKSSDFKNYTMVYDSPMFTPSTFSENGLYLVEIENVYGNVTKYYLIKSESFMATLTVELADGTTFDYSGSYDKQVLSNKYVFINAYSENVSCEVLKDGQAYSGAVVTVEKGITVIKLNEQGAFSITVTDEFGNKYMAKVEISLRDLAFDEDLIYGYNENALRKSEGYTNKLLSISKAKLTEHDIYFISIIYNGKETVLLDLISEDVIDLSTDEILNSCIGKNGEGEYKIVFRDKYGNAMPEKTIRYKNGATLILSRTIRSSTDTLSYDISEAVKNGFWANNSLIFESTAEQYVFKVDGTRADCPRTFTFGSGAEEGNFVYKIYYQDEYGNVYEFEAHLFRQKLELVIPSSVKTITEDGALITKNNISLIVPANTICTYLLNGVEKEYISNAVLTGDGSYRFTVKDLAGNISALSITKDTVVEYAMTEIATNNKVINGGIICTDKVSFNVLNGDSAYIKYVFKDGELVKGFNDNKFSGNGKWEIIISDNIGNESYFTFQIILHKLKSFDYTVPYGYKVTEIWYNSGDGVPISYMQYVKGEGTILNLTENGKYSVVMSSQTTGLSSSFSVTVNNAKPQIKLVGCNENETTLNDVTISGYKVGDKILVYRDKKLYKTVEILTSQTDAPTITEGGNYTIVVMNEAGVETSVSFVKKHVPNTPGNVLIITLIMITALIVFIGLIYRQRSKVDE